MMFMWRPSNNMFMSMGALFFSMYAMEESRGRNLDISMVNPCFTRLINKFLLQQIQFLHVKFIFAISKITNDFQCNNRRMLSLNFIKL